MKSLVFGLLWVSTAVGHAVDLPVTLYEMDFTAPEVGSYSIWYGSPPAVRSSVPPFEDALFFDAVGGMEQIALPINVVAPRYEIQYDVLVHNLHDSLYSFTVLLDTPSVRTVTFHPGFDSIDMYNLGRLMPFSNDTVYHFNMVVDFREDLWALTINDSAHFSTTIAASALRSIRFSFSEWRSGAPDEPQTYAALDNVVITAIPEPTTFTMLGLGSLVLMFGRIRAPRNSDVMKKEPNPYPARSIGKKLPRRIFSFPFFCPLKGNSVLVSDLQLGHGVRLNTYLDSTGRSGAWREPDLTGLPVLRSNAAARSRNTQQSTQGLSIQVEGGSRLAAGLRAAKRVQFFADVPLGRMLQNSFQRYVLSALEHGPAVP